MLSADFLITDVCLSVRFVADMKTCVFKNINAEKDASVGSMDDY